MKRLTVCILFCRLTLCSQESGQSTIITSVAGSGGIYDSEINLRISWLWDGGIDVRLGDEMNGYLAGENVRSVNEIIPWLQETIAHFLLASTYAASLDPELRRRAAVRVFRPPKIGATAIGPHCGAPNASMMDELIAYVCSHCGEAVEVEPPKVQ
jgi:hypothetical protein